MSSILQQLQSNQPSTQPQSNQNGLDQAVQYVKTNGGNLKECVFKKGRELGMTDAQINQLIEQRGNDICQMIQASRNPAGAVQNAMLARSPMMQKLQGLAGTGNNIMDILRSGNK